MTTTIERIGPDWRALVETRRLLAVAWCATREDAERWVRAMREALVHGCNL